VGRAPAQPSAEIVPIRRTSDPEPVRRRRGWPSALSALSVPAYRLWLSSQVIATTGLWMQRIAQDWLVLEISGSVAAVGVAVALQFLPVLLFGLLGGVIVDRFPKRTLLIITQSVAALLAATLGILALSGAAQVWQVYLVAFALGMVTVIDNPTRQVFVAELVGDQHIGNAVSLNSSVFQFGALVGPALTGILIAAVGQGWSFLINAAACLRVVGMVAVIRPTQVRAPKPVGAGSTETQRGQLRAGLRYIRRTSEVAWAIVLVGTIGVLGLNLPVLLTAFADHEFGTGVGGYSLYNSANAAGAFLGAVLSARRTHIPRIRMLVIFLIAFGAVTAVISLAPSQWLFMAGLVLAGTLTLLFLTGANSLVQTSVPAALRGRVMSVYILVLLGGQALGGPVVGWLADQFGARPSMALCGGLIALVVATYAVRIARHSHLGLAMDLHHRHGRSPIRIVAS
jgi:MFS family permease